MNKKSRIIFATGNEGKMREIRLILADLGMEIISMKEAGIQTEIDECGKTFEENAKIKATEVWKLTKDDIVLADDSGLEVDYLNGEPGIYSARYLGEDTSYDIKNRAIIDRMKNVQDDSERTARFVSAIAAVLPDGTVLSTIGTVEGIIAREPAGCGGFGYDPIFFIKEFGITSAQMSMEQKNLISHRGKALEKMKEVLRGKLNEGFDCK